MVLMVATLTAFMDISRAAKITLGAVIGVWIGFAAAAGQAGWITIARPVPTAPRARRRRPLRTAPA
jgi:hypothetical protein